MLQGVRDCSFPKAMHPDASSTEPMRRNAGLQAVAFDQLPHAVAGEWLAKHGRAIAGNAWKQRCLRLAHGASDFQPAEQGSVSFQESLPLDFAALLTNHEIETV